MNGNKVAVNAEFSEASAEEKKIRPLVIIADDKPDELSNEIDLLLHAGIDRDDIIVANTGREALDLWLENQGDVGAIIQKRYLSVGGKANGLNGMQVIREIYEGNDNPPAAFLQCTDLGDPLAFNMVAELGIDIVYKGDLDSYVHKVIAAVNNLSSYNLSEKKLDAVKMLSEGRPDNNIS